MPESGGKSEHVLVGREARPKRTLNPLPSDAWRGIGWFGSLLAAVGLTDLALVLVPPGFGNPEWEFGTVAQLVAGLPLLTLGVAGLLAAGLGLGKRWLLLAVGSALVLMALVLVALLALFLGHVPMALGVVEEPALTGIKKAVVKTVLLGMYFAVGFGSGGFWALRSSLGRS